MAEPATLECDHCGGVAIASDDGTFADGDGERCESCGMRGHVMVDDDGAYWWDEPTARCRRSDCFRCREDYALEVAGRKEEQR